MTIDSKHRLSFSQRPHPTAGRLLSFSFSFLFSSSPCYRVQGIAAPFFFLFDPPFSFHIHVHYRFNIGCIIEVCGLCESANTVIGGIHGWCFGGIDQFATCNWHFGIWWGTWLAHTAPYQRTRCNMTTNNQCWSKWYANFENETERPVPCRSIADFGFRKYDDRILIAINTP